MVNPPDETVYNIWIGTNDIGQAALLTDSQVKGTNIVNYTSCVFDQMQAIYDQGGRYFVLMNIAPLNLVPLYALPEAGGVRNTTSLWPTKGDNLTYYSYRMEEQVVSVNEIFDYRAPFLTKISESFKGAEVAVFDMHGLVSGSEIRGTWTVLTNDVDLGHVLQPIGVSEWLGSAERHELLASMRCQGRELC
jgi:hypothetical protein